jgi:hypothetical protein
LELLILAAGLHREGLTKMRGAVSPNDPPSDVRLPRFVAIRRYNWLFAIIREIYGPRKLLRPVSRASSRRIEQSLRFMPR